jgi:glycosyltransferase involved in cell wall biosynthesis
VSNVVAWPRGVDTALFRPAGRRAGGAPVFLYVGRVAREKNVEDFLTARLPGTKVVVGGGPELPRLKAAFPSVTFTGCLHGEQLVAAYARSDVLVFPSRTDTFGLVIVEALACGVPVAACPVEGPADILTDDRLGCLACDLERAAAEALRQGDPSYCRDHAVRHYSWERSAERFVANLVEVTSWVPAAQGVWLPGPASQPNCRDRTPGTSLAAEILTPTAIQTGP